VHLYILHTIGPGLNLSSCLQGLPQSADHDMAMSLDLGSGHSHCHNLSSGERHKRTRSIWLVLAVWRMVVPHLVRIDGCQRS